MKLLEQLARHAADSPDRLALREVATGRTLSYAQLAAEVATFASRLRQEVPANAVVLLRCANRCEYHVAFCASLAAGLTVFPIPPDTPERELAAASAKATVAAVIDDDLAIRPASSPTSAQADGPALLLQSSGTTGLPKIVRRDAPSLDAVAHSMVDALRLRPTDGVLACVPLCHSYGLEHGLLAPLVAGASVHLTTDFDLSTVWRELQRNAVTVFPGVPSIYEMLANLHDARPPTALRLAYSAGGSLPAAVYERMLSGAQVRVGQLYGATEIGSVTFSHPESSTFHPDSVGRTMDGVELRVDENDQLLVRARSMMSGYVGDASPVTSDGFFPTGDLARIDSSGNLFITGRLKLLIDVGGLKVNPLEVELVLSEHPGVAGCVVVPMRLSDTVCRLKAIVTPTRADDPPDISALRAFARDRLSAHKVPRVFELRDSLPRSATGKVLRHLLLETR